jgi:SulP family sulfate permease
VAFGVARLGAVIKYIPNPVIAGFTAGIGVIIFVGQWKDFLLAPLAATIPLCCLAAVLFVVAWNMSELPHALRRLRTAPKTDVAVLVLTFLLTVFVDLVVAVNVGVILAALLFMRRMADSVNVERQETAGAVPAPGAAGQGVVIYSIEGPLFFGAAEKLERTLAHIQRPATTLILRMGNVPFLDATGIDAIEEMVGDFRRHGARVFLVELKPNVRYKLERGGVIAAVGEQHVFETLDQAVAFTRIPV